MKSERGFSLVELLVVITIIGILAAIALPNYFKAKNKAKELEVKANIGVIVEAIERFYVDEGEYPAYLVGGSETSWPVYQQREGILEDKLYLQEPGRYDPLIEYNYIDSYPKNPFIDEDKGGIWLEATGGTLYEPGSGDPRFGLKGTTMANSVDDYMIFNTTPGTQVKTLNLAGTPKIENYGSYGGTMGASGPTMYTIPGSFFYRVAGPIDMAMSDVSGDITRRSFQYKRYDRFIIGGFGHDTTRGLDIYRINGAGVYTHQPDTSVNFPWDVPLILPETFGGGDNETNPFFPYTSSEEGVEFYYGAPDGYEDGVILVITDSGENISF